MELELSHSPTHITLSAHFKVDDETLTRAVRGSDYLFGHFANNSAVLVAGIPEQLGPEQLTNPWTYYEPKLAGSIKNVMYASDQSGRQTRAQLHEEGSGFRTDRAGAQNCAEHDPCLHSGRCISTDLGAICDCARTDYQGTFCQQGECEIHIKYIKKYVYLVI